MTWYSKNYLQFLFTFFVRSNDAPLNNDVLQTLEFISFQHNDALQNLCSFGIYFFLGIMVVLIIPLFFVYLLKKCRRSIDGVYFVTMTIKKQQYFVVVILLKCIAKIAWSYYERIIVDMR
jgi:hypothetical protein